LPFDPLPAGPALRIDKVPGPMDFSRCSLDNLRYAIQFAQEFAPKITVLHLGYSQPMDIYATGDLTRFARAALKDAKAQMRNFIGRVSQPVEDCVQKRLRRAPKNARFLARRAEKRRDL
jgi:hypothetical protein